jgi:hypothetical protein
MSRNSSILVTVASVHRRLVRWTQPWSRVRIFLFPCVLGTDLGHSLRLLHLSLAQLGIDHQVHLLQWDDVSNGICFLYLSPGTFFPLAKLDLRVLVLFEDCELFSVVDLEVFDRISESQAVIGAIDEDLHEQDIDDTCQGDAEVC